MDALNNWWRSTPWVPAAIGFWLGGSVCTAMLIFNVGDWSEMLKGVALGWRIVAVVGLPLVFGVTLALGTLVLALHGAIVGGAIWVCVSAVVLLPLWLFECARDAFRNMFRGERERAAQIRRMRERQRR